MKIRMKFIKSGSSKFIGHLDVMRYFQKAFRRADLDVEYSKGYSPHQILSFAAPLGVGLTSDGEYLDVQLNTCEEPSVMIQKVNAVMADGFQVIDFKLLPDSSKNAMSIVAAADYMVSVKDGYEYLDKVLFEEKMKEFYNREQIVIVKKSKKSENEVDIKPFIYHISLNPEIENTKADTYENGIRLGMQLATGSVNNLKPELVMEAFCQYVGLEFNSYVYQIHRMEVYADLGDETTRKLVALNQMEDEQ